MIAEFISEYLGEVLDLVSPAYADYIIGAVAVFLIQLFTGGLIQLLFSAVGLIYNVRGGVRKK